MLLKADNRNLTQNQPTTILTAAVSASDTTLTVKSNDGFSQDDFVLLGKIGDEASEIKRITASVSAGTSLTISPLTYAHSIDTPVTKLDYDQVNFKHSSTATGSKANLTIKSIDPTHNFTYYNDTSSSTGYGFCRLKDSNAGTYSAWSDAIPYTGYTDKMLRSIRKKVRRLLNEPDDNLIKDEEVDDEINLSQREIAHDRIWSFYEGMKSFSSVANQYEYSLASNVFKLYSAKFETQPLAVIDIHRWNRLRWDTNTTGDPTHICMWDDKARVYPYPSSGADSTTLDGGITATATTISLTDASSMGEQGRVIIGSEVISYTGKDSNDLTGCTRDEEGTTAASHSDSDTVTERDFIYHFQEEPTNLTDETDETAIPEPSTIAYKAAAELALRKDDEVLHDRMVAKFQKAMVQLRKIDQPKINKSFPVVTDQSEVVTDWGVYRNPNDYPKDLTSS